MATTKSATITLAAPGSCLSYYEVQYKLTTADGWMTLSPAPTASPFVLPALTPDQSYDMRIRTFCCDGTYSDWVSSDPITT